MPANFSVAYDCYSLKTISDFYIFNTKISKLQISLQSSRTSKGLCRRLPTGALQFIQLSKLTFAFTLRL